MGYQWTLYEKRDRIAFVTLNRPEALNAVHEPMNGELEKIWQDFTRDPDLWVAILSGAGDAFCAGTDMEYLATHPESRGKSAASARGPQVGGLVRTKIWKPIIAAVKGACLGSGLEIALCCDLIVAADNAEFGLPEIRTTGSLPLDGGPIRLPRQLPLKIVMELLLTGGALSAERVHQLGLVNRVVPVSQVMREAERMAAKILEACPETVRLAKEFVAKSSDMPAEYPYQYARTAWDLYYDLGGRMRASQDYRSGEGMKALVEQRKPRWTGR